MTTKPDSNESSNDLTDTLVDIASNRGGDSDTLMSPRFIRASMTVANAARQAAMRGYILKASWDPTFGLRVVAIKRT